MYTSISHRPNPSCVRWNRAALEHIRNKPARTGVLDIIQIVVADKIVFHIQIIRDTAAYHIITAATISSKTRWGVPDIGGFYDNLIPCSYVPLLLQCRCSSQLRLIDITKILYTPGFPGE